MEFETTETARSTQSRHEKSLGLLTIKFVRLLQDAKDGVLDLKVAADSLAVKQKRRIYDITNVLEGVGLIEKKNKNIIQWRGENIGSQTEEVLQQVKVLKAQIAELEAQEKELDNQKVWLEENIKHLSHDPIASTYKFVTHEDICSAFSGETLLAVVAPAGTQLEVPLPEMGQSGQKKYQVNLRSHSAPIQVMLINRDSDSRVPVVFSVPPTNDISQIPTPPGTPASQQRFPLSNSTSNITTSSCCCSQESLCSDHQMVLPEHDDVLTPSATPPDMQIAGTTEVPAKGSEHGNEANWISVLMCHSRSALEEQQMDLVDQELQSVLDMSSLLKFSTVGDHMKDDREGAVDLIDELMSADGIDYSFNLDDHEGVCDLFDVQILNY